MHDILQVCHLRLSVPNILFLWFFRKSSVFRVPRETDSMWTSFYKLSIKCSIIPWQEETIKSILEITNTKGPRYYTRSMKNGRKNQIWYSILLNFIYHTIEKKWRILKNIHNFVLIPGNLLLKKELERCVLNTNV